MALRSYDKLTKTNPIRHEGTVNWLKYEIKLGTDAFNRRYTEMAEKGAVPSQLEEIKERLREYSGYSTPKGKDKVVGYGISGKNKKWLERQYRELRRALTKDVWSEEAVDIRDDAEKQAYDQFNKNQHVNWTYDKWKHMVDVFGNLDMDILHGFGYEANSTHNGSSTADEGTVKVLNLREEADLPSDVKSVSNSSFVEAFSYAYEQGLDLYTLAERVYKERKEGDDPVKLINRLYDEIKKEVGEKDD